MLRWYQVFLMTLAGSLVVQTWIWKMDSLTDESLWVARMEHMREDLQDGDFQQKDYSSHPGTTILLTGVVFRCLGFSEVTSLEASVAILVGSAIAAVAAMIFLLSPQSAWWIGASGMLAFQPLFTGASPPSAVLGPWIVLVFLTSSFFFRKHHTPRWVIFLVAAALGISLATRLDMTLLLCSLLFAWIALRQQRKAMLGALLGAFGVFTVLDPLFLTHPISHLRYIVHRIELHTFELGVAHLSPWDLFLYAPLAIISWLIGAGLVLRPLSLLSWQREYVLAIAGTTLAASLVLLYAQTQSVRYFFPLIMLWEAILPIWLLTLTSQSRWPRVASAGVLSILVAGQAFLLWHAWL